MGSQHAPHHLPPPPSPTFTSVLPDHDDSFISALPSPQIHRRPGSFSQSRRILPRALPSTLSRKSHLRGPVPSSTFSVPEAPEADPDTLSQLNSDPESPETTPSLYSPSFSSSSDPPQTSPSSPILGKSDYGWNTKSVTKRISWGWNQTFAGLTPQQLTEVSVQRGKAKQITVQRRRSVASIKRVFSDSLSLLALSGVPEGTSDAASLRSTDSAPRIDINKPFAPQLQLLPVVEADEQNEPLFQEDRYLSFDDPDQQNDDMGLARAVSKRFHRSGDSIKSGDRAQNERKERPKISLPIALITSTSPLTKEAPDIKPQDQTTSSSASSRPTTPTSSSDTPDLTDDSSDGSRSSSDSPARHFSFTAPNHLTQYFESADNKSPTTVEVVPISPGSSVESSPLPNRFSAPSLPPVVPRRAASHSKREHVRLARARSVRSSGAFLPSSLTTLASRHMSLESQGIDETHPFSRELAQLDEVQEDFNSILIADEAALDEAWLAQEGYKKFTSSVYCDDLADMEAWRFID